MPEPASGPLKKLYRVSVSEDIYDLIVAPLVDAIYETPDYKNTANILDTLVELHKNFWHIKGPQPFPGAVAGRFEELMLPLRKAMTHGRDSVKVGAEAQKITKEQRKLGETDWSLGGDVTVYKSGGPTLTYQLKVASAHRDDNIVEHINKAGAQLTGETGEYPEDGSTKVVYMLVQNTHQFDSYDSGAWKNLVVTALGQDYVSDRGDASKGRLPRIVTADKIRNAVDVVKIFTVNKRFKFTVLGGVVQDGAEKGPSSSKYLAYSGGKLESHWNWLMNWFKTKAAENKDDWADIVKITKENGVNGKVGTWKVLPQESPTGLAL